MKSIFEIKNPLPFDSNVFDGMKDIAIGTIRNAEKNQYAQAIVVLTANGNKYSAFIGNALSIDKLDEKNFVDKLFNAQDTIISRILCLWQDGAVDIPSLDFRKMLYSLNPTNANAGIFVVTKDGYSVIKLDTTLK